MKPKRVIFINATDRTITETTVSGLEDCQKLVGGLIERGLELANGDELYVNEEGLFQSPNYFFSVKGWPNPFAGNAYVIGSVTASGNNRPAKLSVDDVAEMITFLGEHEVDL